MRLVRAIHANAARLFRDACTLYRAKAFPSAYVLATLAYEELGKLEMVDHVGFEEMLSHGPRMSDIRMEHLFSRRMFYSHRNKQAWGTYRSHLGQCIKLEALERNKQNATYIGFRNGRIKQPLRVRAIHAYKQLRYTLGAFDDINDMPFYGIHEESTEATRRRARYIINKLKKDFARCGRPRVK